MWLIWFTSGEMTALVGGSESLILALQMGCCFWRVTRQSSAFWVLEWASPKPLSFWLHVRESSTVSVAGIGLSSIHCCLHKAQLLQPLKDTPNQHSGKESFCVLFFELVKQKWSILGIPMSLQFLPILRTHLVEVFLLLFNQVYIAFIWP